MSNYKTLDFLVFKNKSDIKQVMKLVTETKVNEFMIKWSNVDEYVKVIRKLISKLNEGNFNFEISFNECWLKVYK